MRTGTEVVNPCIQILDTVDPKVPLKEIQKEKKIANNNIANNHMYVAEYKPVKFNRDKQQRRHAPCQKLVFVS